MTPEHLSSPPPPHHAGIVLAAGASIRMGQPKALLPSPDGFPLVIQQASLLFKAGYQSIHIVLGAAYADILQALQKHPAITLDLEHSAAEITIHQTETVWTCRWSYNVQWENGRLTSMQTGLKQALENSNLAGCTILPVDTVGVANSTLQHLRDQADRQKVQALRPYYDNKKGNIIWLSRDLCQRIITLEPIDTRLDQWVQDYATNISIQDPAILSNINTFDEWTAFLS